MILGDVFAYVFSETGSILITLEKNVWQVRKELH